MGFYYTVGWIEDPRLRLRPFELESGDLRTGRASVYNLDVGTPFDQNWSVRVHLLCGN